MCSDNHSSPAVGLFSAYVPRELFHAMGCSPVRVFPSATKPTAAEAYLPRNFCSLIRLILASFLENGATDGLDAVIFADEDDATRRLHDVWRACVPVPVWGFVDVPRAATPLAAERYADVLKHLATDLEAFTHRSLNANALRQAILCYNEQRDLLTQLKSHWQTGSVNTIAYRRLRRMALAQDPLTANETLRQALDRMEQDEPDTSALPTRPRLLLLAELAAPAGLVRLVEERGARVVAEDSDLDERELAKPVSSDANAVDELLSELSHAYLAKPPSPRMRDTPRRLDYLTQVVAERGVQAAICAYGKFCDLHLAEFPTLNTHLEGLSVPVLLLELEDETISGQHRTRVEAFLEMVSEG
jgi:benzoyl-CoA reductase/2-hydroxyglutaryl-CoA dehydratase subunit BcrC/BadD/HgdB